MIKTYEQKQDNKREKERKTSETENTEKKKHAFVNRINI